MRNFYFNFIKTIQDKGLIKFANKYTVTFTLFLVWMIFFDNNSIYRQIKRKMQILELNRQISYFKNQLEITNFERNALYNDQRYFEKFVREKYLLKKENEDIFVFSEEKNNSK